MTLGVSQSGLLWLENYEQDSISMYLLHGHCGGRGPSRLKIILRTGDRLLGRMD